MSNTINNTTKRFSEGYTTRSILSTYCYLSIFFLRGLCKRFIVGTVNGFLFIGKNVVIRYPSQLHLGKDTIIEDGAEINCLSKDGIQLGNRVTIGKYAIIRPSNIYGGALGQGLQMGNNSNIGPYNYIGCSGKIIIGNNVMLAPRVSIYAENHVFDNPDILIRDQGVTYQTVTIEDDCWIAANSIILAGVTIGKGSVVAAGSVVTENVAPYSVVAGVPAKFIKSRKG